MSRAFVKEPDGDEIVDQPPERLHSDLPNYITHGGLVSLQEEINRIQDQISEWNRTDTADFRSKIAVARRDLRFFEERLRRAIPVEPPDTPEEVVFGVTVRLEDEDENEYRFTLVGEDETDVESGRVCWAAPIAKLLIGRQVGDEIIWPRGDTRLTLEIVEIFL